ncbi:MAG: hypothetical protein AB7N80_05960 [Bdellovibrionales bacterium]
MRVFSMILALILAISSCGVVAEPTVYFRSNGKFVGQGEEYKHGFWIPVLHDAEPLFSSDPRALHYYKQHVRYGKWFAALNWGAVGAYLTYAIATISDSSYDYNFGTGLAIFFVPWLIGGAVGAESRRSLVKAMNIINGVAPDQARQQFLSLPKTQVAGLDLVAPIWAWSF